ncbi:MAG: glycosyltransferase [Lachnospiraceae bacterium]|nr:glycosyltransferase [Lachnospiraceae bacterium]
MHLVTIVVPVYNVEKYLKKCVDSLVNQTYKNIEIVLVDDGSTDSSGMICDEYALIDPRVKVVHKTNAGLGYARNTGLDNASGDYVTFIDSDDIAEPDLVKLLLDAIECNDADTCIGGFKRVSENGNIEFIEQYSDELYTNEQVYDLLFARMLGSAPDKKDAIRMSVWNVMYSMHVINRNHLRFPSEREFISEDIIWDSEYYKHAKRVKVINSTSYLYRITPGSLTQKYRNGMLEKICYLYEEVEKKIAADESKITRFRRQFFVNVRSCIHQEKHSISGKKPSDICKTINLILSHPVVERNVRLYPINKIQIKQRMFLIVVKYKLRVAILLLMKVGVI